MASGNADRRVSTKQIVLTYGFANHPFGVMSSFVVPRTSPATEFPYTLEISTKLIVAEVPSAHANW